MKKIIALSLVAGGLAFAQSGLMGGTSGIHQHNAYTLGQWGIEVGTGGDVSFDSWSLSRGGTVRQNGQSNTFHEWAGTFSGNFHAAEPLAMNASVSRITGVMCSTAILQAVNAASKQFVGDVAAMTVMGLSPLRP